MTRKAVVVGAGIAGLATALRLHQIGWESLVVERSPARRSGGYAVTFSGIGYDAAERMGVLPALTQRHITPDRMVYVKPDGSTRFAVAGPTVRAMLGKHALNLLRGDIEDVLHTAVRDSAEIRFGTTITAIAQDDTGVDVTLNDGTVERADLVVGADGLHSTTRSLVFGPEDEFRLDLDHMVGVFLLDRLPSCVETGTTSTLTDTGRTLAIIDLGQGRSAAFFGYRTDRPAAELAEGPASALPRGYGDMGWAAPEVLAQLPHAESVYFDTISQVIVDRWSRGRVVLLGDAAWCVTLFAGFGSSLAVAGADRLGTALDQHHGDVLTALKAWEEELRPEAEKKQKLGRRVRGLYAPADPFRLWLRDLPLRFASYRPVSALLQRSLQLGA
ncbi:FAD-dependent monooxygenase [Saccharomonospora xinjiangensis]|uniref:2-polyprenyl-6-methoxyphenol hydroxylase-like oxidoreductase n=1 Tax=Saccharomonospora xinjiangensis XJ-54 TaxID=882086 RepID=I0V7Q3_9PSEU|nr:FAD-dependent monooxygenase [Saccharomonospora xinjiangensis]EID56156.1 2-polyprenyl-6-methoxyphenol hydroxylase-like oxidoreductase [Saccharomonospora xinjiangensis XJ-54]